jgi:hypothetical protein
VRRKLFNVTAVVSLLLFVAAVVSSLRRAPLTFLTVDLSRERHLYIRWDGGLDVSVLTTLGASGPSISAPNGSAAPGTWVDTMRRRPSIAGFEFGRRHDVGVVGQHMQVHAFAVARADGFRIPAWFIILLTALLPLRWVRMARDKAEGPCCPTCGYNLTGNVSGVCPECGTQASRHLFCGTGFQPVSNPWTSESLN